MKWYKQDSRLFDRPWAKDAKAVALYVYLHVMAYVQDGMYHGILIRRGSCPTSRSAIVEATGLSDQEVRSRLKLLLNNNEIIIKSTNLFSVVTCCDYDGYVTQENFFELDATNQQPTNNQPTTNQQPTTPIYNKNIEYNNILRSNKIPSKKERENSEALVREIKALYNLTFAGQLIEWKRLSEKMIIKVDTCIQRFGRQSVDMVFDQIKHEPFSLGDNNTGFRADFDFIFRIDQYEKYLSRYKLRIQKGSKVEPVYTPHTPEKPQPSQEEKRKALIIQWIEAENKTPTQWGQELLQSCYNSGELEQLGLEWKPNHLQ